VLRFTARLERIITRCRLKVRADIDLTVQQSFSIYPLLDVENKQADIYAIQIKALLSLTLPPTGLMHIDFSHGFETPSQTSRVNWMSETYICPYAAYL